MTKWREAFQSKKERTEREQKMAIRCWESSVHRMIESEVGKDL